MIKAFNYILQSLMVYIFFVFAKIIGLKTSRYLSAKIFIIFGKYFRSKKIIFKNLEKIIPNASIEEKDNLINKMWSNYGKTFVEYAHLKSLKRNSNHIKLKNRKILNDIVSSGKPVIFISGHFANYELMSMELVKANIKLATIYRPLNNYFLNPYMEHVRRSYVCKNQIKKGIGGVKEAITFMKKNYSVALMVDQRVSEGPRVVFFNDGAHTTTLPAQLSNKFNCNIVPIYISRNSDETFDMEIMDPLKIQSNGDDKKNTLTLEINKVMEKLILRDPGQWILTHNRWK